MHELDTTIESHLYDYVSIETKDYCGAVSMKTLNAEIKDAIKYKLPSHTEHPGLFCLMMSLAEVLTQKQGNGNNQTICTN